MKVFSSVIIVAALAAASPAFSQNGTPVTIDCSIVANAENAACLPDTAGVTNAGPLVAGVAGLAGLGALAGGGSSTSTTATSTTGTN